MKNKKDYSILVGGAAGQGSRKAGLIIAKIFNNLGYEVYIQEDYQSLIKGGHNFSVVRVSEKESSAVREKIDFLLALDEKTIKQHEPDLEKDGVVIFNSDKFKNGGTGVSADTIVKELNGLPVMSNTALIAGFCKVAGIDFKTVEDVLREEIGKGIEKNLEIAEKVYSQTEQVLKVERLNNQSRLLATGNEAAALGAVKAGLQVYSAYPMTPATSILHYLADHQKDFKVIVSQMENEIAVINFAIGSSYAGKRAMVATSGGGFALMTEAISLSAMSETPMLVINSQRSGPATGVPTYSGQGDLLFSLAAGHGDFVRFVAAPGDANESCYWAGKLMNLAWKYQTPAILLMDKEVSESTYELDEKILNSIKKEEEVLFDGKGEYNRYAITTNGISPLAFPGGKETVKATSYEHDEQGLNVEDKESIIAMQEKRLRKFKEMEKEVEKMEAVKVFGNMKSKTAVVCWGSTKGVVVEAAESLGLKVIQIVMIQPFPTKQLNDALKGVSKLVSVEANATGQMEQVLKSQGIKVDERILKYDMRPFTVEELEEKLKKI
jgi:2-oxoglutarate/2-oxoacid ferredoxin oxidoreductase subunit alpha